MKNVVVAIIVLVVVIGAILLLVFTRTGGLVRSADQFFALVRQGNVKDAYLSTSREFQAATSEEGFGTYLNTSSLADFKSATWSSWSVTMETGELKGSIKTRDGGTIPVTIKLVKEDGRWKIRSFEGEAAGLIKTPGKKTDEPTAPEMPAEYDLKALTSRSVLLLAQAINSKDFSEFYGATAEVWQSQTTPEALKAIFMDFVEKNTDLTFIQGVSPEFSESPVLDENGTLILKGYYPTQPDRLNFTVKYVRQESEWKLVGMYVTLEQAPDSGPSATGTHEMPSEEEIVDLTNQSMMLLARAVSRDDFSDFYASLAKVWQEQITQEKLREPLVDFIEKKIPLTVIEGVSPVFSQAPFFDQEGVLIVNGQYPTTPYRVEFNLEFYYEDSLWRLLGFNIQTKTQR